MSDLYSDRQTWTADQHRAAAAVLGYEAGLRLQTVDDLRRLGFGRTDYEQGMLAERESAAQDLARQAAHYAGCAIEIEAVDAGTLGQVCR